MTSGVVFDIKEFTIHDGPGIRTTVLSSPMTVIVFQIVGDAFCAAFHTTHAGLKEGGIF
jgi:hypothetical protein